MEQTFSLELKHLHKSYPSKQGVRIHALKDFTYRFTPGVYGILGPNGAGKSTLFNLLAGILEPDSGSIRFLGQSLIDDPAGYKKYLGFSPQQQEMYPDFTVKRFLSYMGALKRIHARSLASEIKRVLEWTDLQDKIHSRISSLSGGMKQRLLIAQSLLGDPKILILDEPTAGLDPAQRLQVKNIFSDLARDKIVLISTHVVTDIEHIAKTILFIKEGSLYAAGSPRSFLKKFEGKVIELLLPETSVQEIRKRFVVTRYQELSDGRYLLRICGDYENREELLAVERQDAPISLEDIYIYLYGHGE